MSVRKIYPGNYCVIVRLRSARLAQEAEGAGGRVTEQPTLSGPGRASLTERPIVLPPERFGAQSCQSDHFLPAKRLNPK
jgi:hypothetical protein